MLNKTYLRFATLFFAVVLLVAGGYFVWGRFFRYDVMKVYQAAEKKYVEAMKADTYGGKTPKETLDLFVAALRANDIDLASKYFLLDDNASRQGWVDWLNSLSSKDLIRAMASDISKAFPDKQNLIDQNDYKFIVLDENGKLGSRIDMRLNAHTKVWKIESL